MRLVRAELEHFIRRSIHNMHKTRAARYATRATNEKTHLDTHIGKDVFDSFVGAQIVIEP